LGNKEFTAVDFNGETTIEGAVNGKTTTINNNEKTVKTSAYHV